MNYKEISNEDKIAAIMKWDCWPSERLIVEQYLEALITNNRKIIEEFETFGDNPRQIVMNKLHHDRAASAFGFTAKTFNEYGWLKYKFLDCETFRFGCGIKGYLMGQNSIIIGRGQNGKWTYGSHCAVSSSGRCYGLSVFDKPYASRHECLIAALADMLEWHAKENDKRTARVIKETKDMLDDLTGRKPQQLSFF